MGKIKKERLRLEDIPIGDYLSFEDKWEVRLDEEIWFTCKNQIQAEMLSRLVKLERRVKK